MSEFNHHGIQGQKWGVQNGPPYPLDAEEHKKVVKQKKKEMRETAKQIRERLSKNYLSLGIGEKSEQRDMEMRQLMREYYTQKVDYLNTKDIEKGKKFVEKYTNKPYGISISSGFSYISYSPKYDATKVNYMYLY